MFALQITHYAIGALFVKWTCLGASGVGYFDNFAYEMHISYALEWL